VGAGTGAGANPGLCGKLLGCHLAGAGTGAMAKVPKRNETTPLETSINSTKILSRYSN
jgi:hypothetical protein